MKNILKQLAVLAFITVVFGLGLSFVSLSAEEVQLPEGAAWLVNDDTNHVWYKKEANAQSKYTLTIGGTGSTPDYGVPNYSPFYQNNNISEIIIESDVTGLGSYLFYGSTALKNVTIPKTVTNIGAYAFANCSSLETVKVASRTVGQNAFSSCANLKYVYFLDGVQTISANALNGDVTLTKVDIAQTVTSIGAGALNGVSVCTYYFRGGTPPTLQVGAISSQTGCVIYVPAEAYLNYCSAYAGYADKIKKGYIVIVNPCQNVIVTPSSNYVTEDDFAAGPVKITLSIELTNGYSLEKVAFYSSITPSQLIEPEEGVYAFWAMEAQMNISVSTTKTHVHGNASLISGVAATCSQKGTMDYYKCSCGNYFADFDCLIPIDNLGYWKKNEGSVPTTDHQYDGVQPEYTWDGTSCTAVIPCKVCGKMGAIKEEKAATYYKDTDANCITNELGHLEAHFSNSLFYTQKTDANSYEQEGTMLAHTYGKASYTWNADNTACTAQHACTKCGTEETETQQAVSVSGTTMVSFEIDAFDTQVQRTESRINYAAIIVAGCIAFFCLLSAVIYIVLKLKKGERVFY